MSHKVSLYLLPLQSRQNNMLTFLPFPWGFFLISLKQPNNHPAYIFSVLFMPLFFHGVRESANTFRRSKLNVSKFNFSLLWNSSRSHFGLWEKILIITWQRVNFNLNTLKLACYESFTIKRIFEWSIVSYDEISAYDHATDT